MRFFTGLFVALSFTSPTLAQKQHAAVPMPDHFEIGRHTFFDFGPPFDYYELLLVRSNGLGASIQRIILTPPGDECTAPAAVDVASASMSESISVVLGNENPCEIPEKELRRELKRCKHCIVFSGANITMRVPCGAGSRLIRSDILDKDMFSTSPKTPEHTSWTMQLLARLDQALGPGVMEKPVFSLSADERKADVHLDTVVERELGFGVYDELFPYTAQKLSELYHAAQIPVPRPTAQLLGSLAFPPQDLVLPQYPPLALATHTEGIVSFTFIPDAEGSPTSLTFNRGHPLLLEAVRHAIATWKFPKDAAGQTISASIQFSLNCQIPRK